MSTSQLISRIPRRVYIIAPSVKQKEEILKSIDRYCSLYYITIGSAYNIAQTAMIDAYNAIKEDKKTISSADKAKHQQGSCCIQHMGYEDALCPRRPLSALA